MFNLTPLVRSLILINVIVFILQKFLPMQFSLHCDGHLYGIDFSGLVSLWPLSSCAFFPYQFFTYMFAHGGIGHIFFNMLTLASFAPILENYWGEKKFLFYYLATGIGAGVIYGVVNYFFGDVGGSMLGASGALYGVLMAFGMVFPEMEIMMLFVPIPIKAKYLVFIMGAVTWMLDSSGSVAHLAHFGGAFVGFIIVSFWRSQGRGRGY